VEVTDETDKTDNAPGINLIFHHSMVVLPDTQPNAQYLQANGELLRHLCSSPLCSSPVRQM
jgi:hypothetical protein